MRRAWWGALSLAALVACDEKPPVDSPVCDAICVSTLTFTFADMREDFKLQLYGEGLNTTNLFCPDAIFAGGVQEVWCDPGSVEIRLEGGPYPELLHVSLDDGPVEDVFPTYEPVEMCGTTCNTAVYALR